MQAATNQTLLRTLVPRAAELGRSAANFGRLFMAIRQTRVFVRSDEPGEDWAESLIGRVFRPITGEFAESLGWFWFSRYGTTLDGDNDDCNIDQIPDEYKQPLQAGGVGFHRSLRFRFDINDAAQVAFENRLEQLVAQHGYRVSDIRDYDYLADTGGHRFLGIENRQLGRDVQRANLVTHLYQAISQLVIDCLVGPDATGRFAVETNDDPQNPNGSTFESLHHLFYNITQVPLSVLIAVGPQAGLLGTFWGQPLRVQQRQGHGQLITEVFVPY